MWTRYAAFATPVLLVAALTAAIILTSDAGPQFTSAAVTESPVEASPPPADPQATPTPPADPQITPTPPCENGTVVSSPADNPGLVSDCALLLAAKDTLLGTETLNWSADTAIASWEGITAGGTPLRVTELVLDGLNSWRTIGRDLALNGTIPAELGGLSKLQRLTLSRNELTGTIPVELGNLSELTQLQLYSNQLTGGIPPELGRLANLATALDLSRNQLSGGIPVELGQLSNLRSLRLHNNQLTGAIPAALGGLSSLNQVNLAGNTLLTGCIPESLRGIRFNDVSSLGLDYCTTTTTYTLTTSAEGNGRTSPLPGTHSYFDSASVTVTATPDEGNRIVSWGGDCAASGTATTCVLTLDADRTASVTFEPITHTLTVTAGEGGSVTPGTSTQYEGDELTLTASWNDATHSFTSWGEDCSGTTSTCVLTIDGDKTVTATFTELSADRCATATAADCFRAVYLGAPGDYAQVTDIPADLLLTPGSDGRYRVERGQQYTVVTAAPLPEGWTRFWLDWSPLEFGTPSPVSASQLIQPVGTTYTFTVTDDEAASTLITFDLKQARPFVRPRPDGKPEIGATVVTTEFQVETTTFSYDRFDTTGAVATAGSYAFLMPDGQSTSVITTYEQLRTEATVMRVNVQDEHGASWGDFYDAVVVGDVVEWYEADDCWIRYQIETTPTADTGATRDFGIRWITYAPTGCSGAVTATLTSTMHWRPLDAIPSPALISPVRHGQYLLIPTAWDGPMAPGEKGDDPLRLTGILVEPQVDVAPPPDYRASVDAMSPTERVRVETSDPAEARRLIPLWRDPVLPEGWTLRRAEVGTPDAPFYGYMAQYVDERGYPALLLYVSYPDRRPDYRWVTSASNSVSTYEVRTVDGHAALVRYSPPGPLHNRYKATKVQIFDETTGIKYWLLGQHQSLSGANVDATIEIARSLYRTGQ